MRLIACCALALISASSALATPERDRAWDALISEAQKHGGHEMRVNDTAFYAFQRPDGFVVALTRSLDNHLRAICVIANQNLVACRDWETDQVDYCWRADAASPWTHSDTPPPANPVTERTPVDLALNFLGQVLATGSHWRGRAGGYWRNSASGPHWVNRR